MKHIFCLTLIVVAIAASSCKKDNPSSVSKFDFRDSLVGRYNCNLHEVTKSTGVGDYRDFIISNEILTISKYGENGLEITNRESFTALADSSAGLFSYGTSSASLRISASSSAYALTYYYATGGNPFYYLQGSKIH